jgi:hypothetical protein
MKRNAAHFGFGVTIRSCQNAGKRDAPAKVELVVNMRAAKLLGREFSSSLVSGADEVIE